MSWAKLGWLSRASGLAWLSLRLRALAVVGVSILAVEAPVKARKCQSTTRSAPLSLFSILYERMIGVTACFLVQITEHSKCSRSEFKGLRE
jgi:hypothetical protein